MGVFVSGEIEMLTTRTRIRILLLMCLVLLVPALPAQSLTSGDIAGVVTDPAGGVIPKVTIFLRNNGTGAAQETQSNSEGYYRFSFLPPGSYLVTAKATDFSGAKKS